MGVPVLAIPITNDQPGVAMRLESLGLGTCVALRALEPNRLRAAIQLMLDRSDWRVRAAAFATQMAKIDGPAVAANLLETALCTRMRLERPPGLVT